MLLAQFQGVGRDLFSLGLVSSHSGNLSVRVGERLFITRRGCMLGTLCEQDLVETGIDRNDRATPLAPVELAVHRTIYCKTPALAIIHAHPSHAIALSITEKEIIPSDVEGSGLLPKVPVLGWRAGANLAELAEEIAEALNTYRVVMVSGHGSFAVGQLLEEAYQCTTAFEESCRIICLLKSLGATTALKRKP